MIRGAGGESGRTHRRFARLNGVVLVGTLAGGSACATVVSFDEYGDGRASPTPAAVLRSVFGRVAGLGVGQVELALNDRRFTADEGTFALPSAVPEGSRYEVKVLGAPSLRVCAVENGTGTVGPADVTGVLILCTSTDTALAELSLDAAPLEPSLGVSAGFSIARPPFATFLEPLDTTLRAVPRDPKAEVRVNGRPVDRSLRLLLEPKTHELDVSVTAADRQTTSHHAVTIVVGSPEALPRNAITTPRFGRAVAIASETIAVAAGADPTCVPSTPATCRGRVHTYGRYSGRWTEVPFPEPPPANTDDASFGAALALSEDTLAIGAPDDATDGRGVNGSSSSTPLAASGAVHVYRRSATVWKKEATIKAAVPLQEGRFGKTIALVGGMLVVGANDRSAATGINGNPANDPRNQLTSAVHVFVRTYNSWAPQAYIKSPPHVSRGEIRSVALHDNRLAINVAGGGVDVVDWNGLVWMQGRRVVPPPGVTFHDAIAVTSEAVFVRARRAASEGVIVFDGQSFVEQAFLTTTGANATGEPGSLSANGNRVAVGAAGESTDATGFASPGRPDAAPSSGAVFLFRKDGQDWKSEAFLKAPAALANAEFGVAVDLSTDHLVVAATGEPYRPSLSAPTGTVYVY